MSSLDKSPTGSVSPDQAGQKPVTHSAPYWDIGRLVLSFVLCTLVVLVVVAWDKCG